ncbi:acyltransferase [Pseudescherichia vulneris]|uniref:acyltransferase family protein n=1 Tax=Pseudescherichia vulneris TaxID=566 RepID=UPI00301A67EE
MGKIYSLQILRAIAALCVVISHIWGVNGKIGEPLGFAYFGAYGVDIFFVISGFIMCYSIKDIFDNPFHQAIGFISKRILRIYPSYLIIASPVILYFIYSTLKSGGAVSLYMIIGNFLLLPTFNGDPAYHMYFYVAWSLCYEMMFYLLFALIMVFCRNRTQLIAAMVTVLIGLVAVVHTFRIQGDMLGWVNIRYMVGDSLIVNFAMGCIAFVIYRTFNNISFRPLTSFLLVASLFCMGIINAQHQADRLFCFGLPAFLIVLIVLYTKFDENHDRKKITQLGIYLGNASYSIYLLHLYIVFIMPEIYKIVPFNKDFTGAIMSVVAVLIGCAFYSAIEKPLNRFIHQKNFKKLIVA